MEAGLPGYVAERIGNIIVTAGRSQEVQVTLQPLPVVRDELDVMPSELFLLQEQPSAPLSLSRAEIANLPHLGGDIFRALPLLPGTTANDLTAQFHIHGGRRDEVVILLDGQELYDAHHLKDFDNGLSIVVAEGLSSVNLSTGAFPAKHGDRMSGVLDMTTSSPSGPTRTLLGISLLNAMGSLKRIAS